MQQKFKLEIVLPNGWLLNEETFKRIIEHDTIIKVNKIENVTGKC